MLNTVHVWKDIDGAPLGPWVQGAIAKHRVPRMSGDLIAPNLTDPQMMVLWGLFMDSRGWVQAEWEEYHREQAHGGFQEFARWLRNRYGIR